VDCEGATRIDRRSVCALCEDDDHKSNRDCDRFWFLVKTLDLVVIVLIEHVFEQWCREACLEEGSSDGRNSNGKREERQLWLIVDEEEVTSSVARAVHAERGDGWRLKHRSLNQMRREAEERRTMQMMRVQFERARRSNGRKESTSRFRTRQGSRSAEQVPRPRIVC
jgi:hypothetical protein